MKTILGKVVHSVNETQNARILQCGSYLLPKSFAAQMLALCLLT